MAVVAVPYHVRGKPQQESNGISVKTDVLSVFLS